MARGKHNLCKLPSAALSPPPPHAPTHPLPGPLPARPPAAQSGDIPNPLLRWDPDEDHDETVAADAQAALLESATDVFIVPRGTDKPRHLPIADWLANLDVSKER